MHHICHRGHRLKQPPSGIAAAVVCDVCDRAFVDTSQILGCRICDWDVCRTCSRASPTLGTVALERQTRGEVEDPNLCRRCWGRGRRPLFGCQGAGIFSCTCQHCAGSGLVTMPGGPGVSVASPGLQPGVSGTLQAQQALRSIPEMAPTASPPFVSNGRLLPRSTIQDSRRNFLDRMESQSAPSGVRLAPRTPVVHAQNDDTAHDRVAATQPARSQLVSDFEGFNDGADRNSTGSFIRARHAFLNRMEGQMPRDSTYNVSDDNLCVICFDKPIGSVIDPCGHIALCMDCAERLHSFTTRGGHHWRRCPICNSCVNRILPLTVESGN